MIKIIRTRAPQSLSSKAYQQIHSAICGGSLAPGELLSENALAKQLNMSRTPVREALRMLAMENLVDIRNGIGAYVKPIAWKDIRDIFEVRRALELLSVKTAVYEITEQELDALELRFRTLLRRREAGETVKAQEFTDLDWEFHDLIVERGRNGYVKTVMESINANIRRYQLMSYEALGSVQESTQQHLKLLELTRKKDIPALKKELSSHLDWSIECLIKIL